jgi:hypothetical protein
VDLLELLKPLLTQGVLGLACLAQATMIKKLYADLQNSRQETIDALEARLDSLLSKRD